MRKSIPSIGKVLVLAALAGAPAFAQFVPTGADGAARLIEASGSVQVTRDQQVWALKIGDLVYSTQEVQTGAESYARFQVADGSIFEVFPNSRATFRANGGNVRELLDLWIGRVRVHIEKLQGKPNPNRIQTPTAVISVRGTIFDVEVDDSNMTVVNVEEGLVAVQHALMPYGEPKLLKQGDELRVYRDQPLAGTNRWGRFAPVQRVLSAFGDIWLNRPRLPNGGGSSTPLPPTGGPTGPTLPGDTQGPTPPPPPPPDEE
jgi:ferric-dicitrate binding protein FerR (iron transport regulator)